MEDERDAEYAIRRLDRREFGRHGRRLRVEWSKQEQSGKRSASERRSTANSRPSKTLFVINFDPINTRTRDLERHFEQYGKVSNVRIKKNFAFIQFESQDDATKALEATNMSKLMDRVISVEYAVRDDDANKNGHYLESDRRERSPELARGRGRSPEPDRKRRDRSPEPDRKRRDRSPEPDRKRDDRSPKSDKRRRDRSPEHDRRGRDKSPEPDRRGRDKSPQSDKKGRDISPERPEPDMSGREKSLEPDRRENDLSPESDKRERERSPELDGRGRDKHPETERRGRERSPEPDRRRRDRHPETERRGRERTPEADRKGRDRLLEKSRDHRQSSSPYRREEKASPDHVHHRSPDGKHQEKGSRSPNNYRNSESPENKICYSRSPSSPEKEERD